jgi:diacylglycerol O-acyltransferase
VDGASDGTPQQIPLSPEDRAILELECASVAGHTCKVIRVGPGGPGVRGLRERIAERVRLTPGLTRRLGGSRTAPVWEPAEGFDVAEHVVEHHHSEPVSAGGLMRCVARLFEQRLDRGRPLWRIDVIELENDEQALVWRIHHSLADGTTAIRYARTLLWDEPPGLTLGGAEVRAQHAADEARRRLHLAGYLRREFKRSPGRSPFDGPIGSERAVAFASVPLGRLRVAAKAVDGATLNDAVLTLVAGALHHWVDVHHGRLDTVRVKVPVSLHHEGDPDGNRDSSFSLGLPLGEADPVARLRTVHARTLARKAARDAEEREVLLHRISGVSPSLEQLALRLERSPRRFALNVSNVPGPRERVSVMRAPVLSLHSLAEISLRHALRVSVVSLADQLCFGFCADSHLVPDVATVASGIERETRRLLAAVRYA